MRAYFCFLAGITGEGFGFLGIVRSSAYHARHFFEGAAGFFDGGGLFAGTGGELIAGHGNLASGRGGLERSGVQIRCQSPERFVCCARDLPADEYSDESHSSCNNHDQQYRGVRIFVTGLGMLVSEFNVVFDPCIGCF